MSVIIRRNTHTHLIKIENFGKKPGKRLKGTGEIS